VRSAPFHISHPSRTSSCFVAFTTITHAQYTGDGGALARAVAKAASDASPDLLAAARAAAAEIQVRTGNPWHAVANVHVRVYMAHLTPDPLLCGRQASAEDKAAAAALLEAALAGAPDRAAPAQLDRAVAACVEAGVGVGVGPAVATARRLSLQLRQEAVVARLNALLQVHVRRVHPRRHRVQTHVAGVATRAQATLCAALQHV
jgi:hypothetical protein